ncbi:IclR family transcriptional regulator [Bacillus benzoevorans]|uniref:DNA-binding IclR family transcriptional regulator n=1 Tax=Bacillus benzoevorans TaxID=1456 RepID=A0A7X0HRK6_9BACI|nr:IclR family transcriptional regulator [Bacillus benzoevorans]MBB6444320.1 DNA-binding IclR family transcriptional regulator [Bacillus benzoevorans]
MIMEEETKSQGIQSIEVGMSILKKIAEAGKPLSISEIAIICETSKSKLHRYLTSFVRTGMLDKNQDAKYTLGTELLRLGLKASHKLNIPEIAAPYLREIKEILNETAALAIWGQNGPFFVSWEESNGPVNIGIKVGSQISLTKSAAGQVFAAYMSHEATEKIAEQEIGGSEVEREELQHTIEFIRANRYSYVNSTVLPGINAIASPIFDRSNKLAGSLTIIGLESSLDTSAGSEAVLLLKQKAKLISSILGWADAT